MPSKPFKNCRLYTKHSMQISNTDNDWLKIR